MNDWQNVILFFAAIMATISLALIAHNLEKVVRLLKQIANRRD